MSNDIQKADQIAYRLFTKLVLVVNHARATAGVDVIGAEGSVQGGKATGKVDKWVSVFIFVLLVLVK
jgi:autophagy-related protein 13